MGVERAKEQARDRTFTPDEITRLAVALDKREADFPAHVAGIRLCALTGWRIGETLSLRWADVDADAGRVKLRDTKTGDRVADIPTAALTVILSRPRLCEYVFTADGRAALTYKACRGLFARAVADAGIVDARLHDLRRSFATAIAANGASVFVVRDSLGHSTLAMAQRYVRAVSDPVRQAREEAAEGIAAYMAPKPEAEDREAWH